MPHPSRAFCERVGILTFLCSDHDSEPGAPFPADFAGSGDFDLRSRSEVRELRIRARIYPCRKAAEKRTGFSRCPERVEALGILTLLCS